MAYINRYYCFVTEESISDGVSLSSHPTEKGLPISDTVKKQPISLDISGKIVDTRDYSVDIGDAYRYSVERTISKFESYMKKGTIVTYLGKCGVVENVVIESFSHKYNNKGGADFDMTLREIRVAKSAYKKSSKGTTQQVNNKKTEGVYHTVKKGDTVWNLCMYDYRKYKPSQKWIVENNKHAFSRKSGQWTQIARTMQIGARIRII